MSIHVPVLENEVLQAFAPIFAQDGLIIDCTLGGGGHTRSLLRHARVLAIDQDEKAIHSAQTHFKAELESGRLILKTGRFSEVLAQGDFFSAPLGILADLGYSSDQLEDPGRGLSFQTEGPLDMRLSLRESRTAWDVIQDSSEKELADLIFDLGEERYSRKIARRIIDAKREGLLKNSTKELADLIFRVYPPPQRYGRIHPATRTFQALRIEVNQELQELESLLEHGIMALRTGGRIAVISFHSLEDRRVKQAFQSEAKKGVLRIITKKPLTAGEPELQSNPRSRSAKLRVAEKQ